LARQKNEGKCYVLLTGKIFQYCVAKQYSSWNVTNLKQMIKLMVDFKNFSKSVIPYILNISLLIMLMLSFTGCQLIGDIFRAGVWVGIIIVIIVIALLVWIIRKFIS
jgi:hypothetical protein